MNIQCQQFAAHFKSDIRRAAYKCNQQVLVRSCIKDIFTQCIPTPTTHQINVNVWCELHYKLNTACNS